MEGIAGFVSLLCGLFYRSAPHGLLICFLGQRINALQFLSLACQIGMHIPLQSDRRTGMAQKLAERFNVAPSLQTGGGKGVPQGMRMDFPQRCLLQIALDAFAVTARLHRFCLVTGEKPSRCRKIFLEALEQ